MIYYGPYIRLSAYNTRVWEYLTRQTLTYVSI